MKPKTNRTKEGNYDNCQTPPYALEPLLPHLDNKYIWECAAGRRTLANYLENLGKEVIATDIMPYKDTTPCDFLYPGAITLNVDPIIVTNPPYSIKYEWLERCYDLEHPFALLIPVEMLGTKKGQDLFGRGIEVIFMSPRVDFYMPNKGYEGGGAQFPTAWFTWGLNLPEQINFATLNKPKRSELKEYWEKYL